MMIHRRSRPTVEERSKKATPNAVGVAHYAPLGAAGIMALIGPFCKPHVQRGVMICRPPSRSKTPPGSWTLRGPGLHSTGKSPILMGVQGKDPQWAAGASSMRPLCFADRPGRSKNPLGSSRLAPPRHPWWLSRGFDAAISRKRAFSGVGFLCHVGPCIGVFLLL